MRNLLAQPGQKPVEEYKVEEEKDEAAEIDFKGE